MIGNKPIYPSMPAIRFLTEIGKQVAESIEKKLEIVRIKGESAFCVLCIISNWLIFTGNLIVRTISFPGVPLKFSQIVEDKDYTCATVEEVYSQILKDLKLAEECLSQNRKEKISRIGRDIAAVYLLKSRVFLYMQNWKDALAYAQKTLNVNGNLLDLKSFSGEEVLEESSRKLMTKERMI